MNIPAIIATLEAESFLAWQRRQCRRFGLPETLALGTDTDAPWNAESWARECAKRAREDRGAK